jgi:hypothetical protein
MHREITLTGGEISLLKTLGLSGMPTYGKLLVEQISQGYVLCDRVNVRTMDDVERAVFRVNASYARDLKDAIQPGRRRDREQRRRRRRG